MLAAFGRWRRRWRSKMRSHNIGRQRWARGAEDATITSPFYRHGHEISIELDIFAAICLMMIVVDIIPCVQKIERRRAQLDGVDRRCAFIYARLIGNITQTARRLLRGVADVTLLPHTSSQYGWRARQRQQLRTITTRDTRTAWPGSNLPKYHAMLLHTYDER